MKKKLEDKDHYNQKYYYLSAEWHYEREVFHLCRLNSGER